MKKIISYLAESDWIVIKSYSFLGYISFTLAFLSLFNFFDKEFSILVKDFFTRSNIKLSFAFFILGLICMVISKMGILKETNFNELMKMSISELVKLLLKIFFLVPLIILVIFILVNEKVINDEPLFNTLKSLNTLQVNILYFFSAISLVFYLNIFLRWFKSTVKQGYDLFKKEVPDSQDRLTLAITFLGVVISVVALFS